MPGGDFSAVVAIGRSGGWAFGQGPKPTAWRRSGSGWTQVPFPGGSNEVVIAAGATSGANIWAFEGTDVAHWNGASWSRTSVARLLPAALKSTSTTRRSPASSSSPRTASTPPGRWPGGLFGFGVQPVQQISSDGHGGLWIPMPGAGGQKSYLLHYAAGHLTVAAVPGGATRTTIDTVTRIPGTDDAGVLLEYES